jgi:glycosyltransferase involved in cell wall biosynthesis
MTDTRKQTVVGLGHAAPEPASAVTTVRILAFAYACEPGRGSEPAAGWRWAQMLAQLGETWVITRANNRAAIETELRTRPVRNLRFVYVDLPPSLRRWKRGQRGVRLYYVLWQRAALREARRLSLRQPFDLAWHLTLANGWIGSAACFLDMPFVYGPVGGGVGPPWRLASSLGAKGAVYELLRAAARVSGRYFNPLARASWRRASLILVQNEETRRWLPCRHQSKAEVFPNVILERLPSAPSHAISRVMLFAGRLLPLKGVALAIRALEGLPGWRLIVCGDGPDAGRLRQLASDRGLEDRVEFRGWVERTEVLRTMREEASVFVFPSLHDEAGWVVAEAMASGLPVVCLDVGGPPTLAGRRTAVAPASSKVTAERIARGVLVANEANPESIRESASECLFGKRLDRLERLLQTRRLLAVIQSREATSQIASANGRAVGR